jgi:hypothetical protein
MDMQRHMLILTCGFSCSYMWMGERNEVVTLGRDRFRWHKQTQSFLSYKYTYSSENDSLELVYKVG